MSGDYGTTNTVLRDLRRAVAVVEAAEGDVQRRREAHKRTGTLLDRAEASLYRATRDRDRLSAAAEILDENWRQLPWVMGEGFANKVPRP